MANDNADRVWSLMEKIGFCMLSSFDGEDIRARPMTPHFDREANAIWFLSDAHSAKDADVERYRNVALAFADAGAQKYVALCGTAEVSNDRAMIRELWSTPAKAFWHGADDPNIRALKVTPKDAQYWDSPGTVISYVKMMAAAVTNTRPQIGDSAKVRL